MSCATSSLSSTRSALPRLVVSDWSAEGDVADSPVRSGYPGTFSDQCVSPLLIDLDKFHHFGGMDRYELTSQSSRPLGSTLRRSGGPTFRCSPLSLASLRC